VDPNPGSRAFLNPKPIFLIVFITNFCVKSTVLCFGNKIFLYLFKNIIIYNFTLIFVATKTGRTKKFPISSFGAVVGSGIRNKHPGSATLQGRTVIDFECQK
jgi:hypothetical protein